MSSDTSTKPDSPPFKAAGVGHFSSRLCFACSRPSAPAGGGKVKPHGQWVCKACREKSCEN